MARWRTERDFVRFADAHLRGYFPNLLGHSQLNRRMRALEPELRALQHDLAAMLADRLRGLPIDGHDPAPAMVRVRACRKGLFAGQATFGRSVSKTECVFSFKMGLTVSPKGVITSFGGRCVGWQIFSFSAFHSKHPR